MEKLQRTTSVMTLSRPEFRRAFIAAGGTKKDADKTYREVGKQETWANSLYLIQINRNARHQLGDGVVDHGGMFELTLRRQDRGTDIDWRHVQQIKNQIVGEQHEMVQLFPAESRLRDSANQYWFYGFNNAEIEFPFGMKGRVVNDGNDHGKSKQRPL